MPSIDRLVSALDAYIEEPSRDVEAPLIMPVDNIISVKGRGTVVVGESVVFLSFFICALENIRLKIKV